ncbi:MAG: DUF4922 domain-containing protein [Bacteroidales bacterium]|nr:DUF4922 domain-containing protein [Bacteroidales bacterium]
MSTSRILTEEVEDLFADLWRWKLADENHKAIKCNRRKELRDDEDVEKGEKEEQSKYGKIILRAQYNPSRIRSTAAKTDAASIAKRQCFLCSDSRPKEQRWAEWEGEEKYQILINPYPIFKGHLTIVNMEHKPQRTETMIGDMARLAKALPGYTIILNGAKCGASAPDHAHFQAFKRDESLLPTVEDIIKREPVWARRYANGKIRAVEGDVCLAYVLTIGAEEEGNRLFEILESQRQIEGDMTNIVSHTTENGEVELVVFPRRAFRPKCFYEAGGRKMMVSPASVEVGGVFVLPREEDYEKIDYEKARAIYREVCYQRDEEIKKMIAEPRITVGIVWAKSVEFNLREGGVIRGKGGEIRAIDSGRHRAETDGITIKIDGETYGTPEIRGAEDRDFTFDIDDVEIGVGFHWDQKERQTFVGTIKFVIEDGKLWAVNEVGVETYLQSVVASEMSATSSLELLKAHAIASRSWLMAQVWGKGRFTGSQKRYYKRGNIEEIETWRDREDHRLFDVCADDHCQRYQGIGRIAAKQASQTALKAVESTRGEILTYEGEVCDARFSKCCGGATEVFESCWDDEAHEYLRHFADGYQWPKGYERDLTKEENAERWIEGEPEAYCNTSDVETLRQVLNAYDQSTKDFYRWEVEYTAEEVSELVREKTGKDIGKITEIKALERGKSGRITRLLVEGEKGQMIVGKELEIRRILSKTHLYSSAFVAKWNEGKTRVTLRGAGWGHGVGLCQIGAAVMAEKGFNYRSILYHYFRRAMIEKTW